MFGNIQVFLKPFNADGHGSCVHHRVEVDCIEGAVQKTFVA